MKLRRRQLRTLRAIEEELAQSDPGLYAFFESFGRRTGGYGAPPAEKIDGRPHGMFARLRRRRSLNDQVKNWCAENWKDP